MSTQRRLTRQYPAHGTVLTVIGTLRRWTPQSPAHATVLTVIDRGGGGGELSDEPTDGPMDEIAVKLAEGHPPDDEPAEDHPPSNELAEGHSPNYESVETITVKCPLEAPGRRTG